MDEAKQAILQAKYARIIEILAGKFNGDVFEMDVFDLVFLVKSYYEYLVHV